MDTDITKKEPGKHRFVLTIEYEADHLHTVQATLLASYEPDVRVVPSSVELNLLDFTTGEASFSLIDYRPEPLTVRQLRTSSPALDVRVTENPTEYLPGWRYTFGVTYTNLNKRNRDQLDESIELITSDEANQTILVPVRIRGIDRLRVLPKVVRLPAVSSGQPRTAKIVIRDSLGENVEVSEVESEGLIGAQFDPKPSVAPALTLVLDEQKAATRIFPTTVWIKVKVPCERSIPLIIEIDPAGS